MQHHVRVDKSRLVKY